MPEAEQADDRSLEIEDAYARAHALEAALEWVLLQLLSIAADPKAVLADFGSHMDQRQRGLDEASMKGLPENKGGSPQSICALWERVAWTSATMPWFLMMRAYSSPAYCWLARVRPPV
jgi:hypothetical protein